jgi:hypothetical protein
LSADDALTRKGLATRFRARATPDWKQHAADLETEMLKRGMLFAARGLFLTRTISIVLA